VPLHQRNIPAAGLPRSAPGRLGFTDATSNAESFGWVCARSEETVIKQENRISLCTLFPSTEIYNDVLFALKLLSDRPDSLIFRFGVLNSSEVAF
jgi:hypothetical protein